MVDLDKSVLKRNDLRCPGAPVGLNPNAVLKILCFQCQRFRHSLNKRADVETRVVECGGAVRAGDLDISRLKPKALAWPFYLI